jgi:hypothetical protein
MGCMPRKLVVEELLDDFDRCRRRHRYGKRWMVEIVFSSFKRVLVEALRSRRFLSQKAEASLKVMLYNKLLSIRP